MNEERRRAVTLLVTPDRHGNPRDEGELARRAHRPGYSREAGRAHGPATGQLRLPRVGRRDAVAADEPRPIGRRVSPPHTKTELEEHILRNFARYSRPHLQHATNEWELLVSAQHHGVPTRLLDWSYSPLVAAHFATLGDAQADRVIWQLDWKRVHRQFGFPELALRDRRPAPARRTRRALHPWRMIGEGSHLKPFACMIEPPTLDTRISAQTATFTLCSDTVEVARLFPRRARAGGRADAIRRPPIRDEHGARPAGSGRDGRADGCSPIWTAWRRR